MAFVNYSLLFGTLLVGVPILLHLVMRQQPKQLVFPALRFIKMRRETNRRTLQLRHWLLLLLRCLAIVLLALALARPSIPSAFVGNWILIGCLSGLLVIVTLLAALAWMQQRSRALAASLGGVAALLLVAIIVATATTLSSGASIGIGNRKAPVAAAVVVDTAPRMQYRQANRTRLEQAKGIALELVKELPTDSEVAIVPSSAVEIRNALDVTDAARQVELLEITPVHSSLVDVTKQAMEKVRGSDKSRKEVYVFTDMTRGAWQTESPRALRRLLENAQDEVNLYVVDVGAEKPRNFALGDITLAAQTLPKNGELHLRTTITAVGASDQRTVALYLEESDPSRPIRKDGKTLLPAAKRKGVVQCDLKAGASQPIEFRVGNLPLGVHHGFVQIEGNDGLAVDDRRFFTIEVKEAWPVLVVAPEDVNTTFLTEAIAPYTFRETDRARFQCNVIRQSGLGNENLGDYSVVCLLDPQPLTPDQWETLAKYVEAGGSAAIFLGHNAGAVGPTKSFNSEEAQRVLPGELTRQWRTSQRDIFVRFNDLTHPTMEKFRSWADAVPWNRFPIHRHWGIRPQDDVQVILRYTNGVPALLEKRLGTGRVLTMTTPISEPSRPAGRTRWNDLTLGRAVPYFILINETMLYLVQQGKTELNYLVGEVAVLPNDPDKDPEQYVLFPPENDAPRTKPARQGAIRHRTTQVPGAYRLKGTRGELPVLRGFSVNVPAAASDLTQIDRATLDDILGEEGYQFARNREEIDRSQGEMRVGREFYADLICMLALVLGLEHVLANRFYRKTGSGHVRAV